MKHTPGPWRVDETKALGAYGVWTEAATHPGHDGAGYPSQICSVGPTNKEIPRDQRDANARLIAAAPELLAACKMLLDGDPCEGVRLARLAITKAENPS